MKIILVGASGTLGSAILNELAPRHEIVKVGSKSGDVRVDMADEASIQAMYKEIGLFDALVSAAGNVHFGPFAESTTAQWQLGLNHKLMGQVNLVRHGLTAINEGGSFTLTSGVLSEDPIPYGAGASMVNGAINSFVIGAAVELSKDVRINVVSPTVLKESMAAFGPYFRGFKPVPAKDAALAYSKSVEGRQTGQVFRVL
jgi:NAD(P)-dependent dehydrogenase (short-subunit alcohol dehydrogenase family)